MREKELKLYQSMTDVDERFIEEARHKPSIIKWVAYAAAACIVLAVASGIWLTAQAQKPLDDEFAVGNTAPAESEKLNDKNSGEILLSELSFPETSVSDEVREAMIQGSQTQLDMMAFNEDMLREHSCILVEGTVKDCYIKHYPYDEKDFIGRPDWSMTFIYEIEVEKVWYSDIEIGDTIIVEDGATGCLGELELAVKKGGRYVLPLYDTGDTFYSWGDVIEKAKQYPRESRFTTLYTSIPQITVTCDRDFMVYDGWETLVAGKSKKVIVDIEGDCYYKDHLRLVDESTFYEQMEVLINKYLRR